MIADGVEDAVFRQGREELLDEQSQEGAADQCEV